MTTPHLSLLQPRRYEFDIKIHMVMTGPGIAAGSTWDGAATNVDLHPTFLALAGLDATRVDGMSFLSQVAPGYTIDHPAGVGGAGITNAAATDGVVPNAGVALSSPWRESIFVHHQRVGAGSYCGPGHFIDQMDNNF